MSVGGIDPQLRDRSQITVEMKERSANRIYRHIDLLGADHRHFEGF